MAHDACIRVENRFHRLQALAPDTLRLQVASREKEFTDDSWCVLTRNLAPVNSSVQISNDRLSLRTEGFHAALPPCRLSDANGMEILALESISAGPEGSAFTVPLASHDLIYGLGQGTGSLNRRDTKKELWNIDVLGHASNIHPNLRSLYQSIPFAILLRDGRAMGIFWDYSGRQQWDFTEDRIRVTSPARTLDLYLFLGPTLAAVLDRYTRLTGRPALPPRWAYGYHQSRYNYGSRQELETIAREFRQRRIPCDALHLDIGHMDGYRVFTFGKTFPRPAQMLKQLARDGFKVAAIVDPGVKNDRAFPVLQRGRARDVFVKRKGSRADFIGRVWPGESRFPDFTNNAARSWWGTELARFLKRGLAGVWNDMTEPAIFDAPGKTLPDDARHRSDFGPRRHADLHNAYGLLMARASFEGALKAFPGKRPFILSRGGHAGIQRYATVWTGDNSSCWEHLAESIPMLLNLGLSGVPNCGADLGGFLDDCTGELLVRWTQLAAFTPFFRNHSNIDTRAQEPWAFGETVEAICRAFINLRYQLLPYLYSCAAEAARTGAPIMRPLAWHFANDPVAARCGDQFLLGPGLMVAPILQKDATARAIYLPRGLWHDFWSGECLEGGRHIVQEADLTTCPLFVRAGAVIPMASAGQFIDPAQPDTEIALHAWLGGRGEWVFHEDDGQSLGYQADDFCRRKIELADLDDFGFLRFGRAEGKRPSEIRHWRVILHGINGPLRFTANGHPFRPALDEQAGACRFRIENCPDPFTIRWQS